MSETQDKILQDWTEIERHEKNRIKQQELTWSRDAIHWENLQRSYQTTQIALYIGMAANIILAISAIIQAQNR